MPQSVTQRPVTLFTGQWADLPRAELFPLVKDLGFDGVELACWGDHFDAALAAESQAYCDDTQALLDEHGLGCWAISNHLAGQAVCDSIRPRHRQILNDRVWGDGDPVGVNKRAATEMMLTAKAARNFGVDVVNGFTGSNIWQDLYFFPPMSEGEVQAGFDHFARCWIPILDEFAEQGVRFALEVHPTEIAYDLDTASRALEAIDDHPAFKFNFDPSHLFWQGINPVTFLDYFGDRVVHVHMKDAIVSLNGTNSILGSHLPFGHPRRGWDFRSLGRGGVDFEGIIRALNQIDYWGPLSVEWEDSGMDRQHGARESCRFVRKLDFEPSAIAFDSQFDR